MHPFSNKPKSIVKIGLLFENVLSTYRWYIKYLYVDRYAIRVEYKLTPPLFFPDGDDVLVTLTDIWGHATDNLGNDYDSAGGAFGLSDDEKATEGVISFVPLPPVKATSINFFIEIKKVESRADSIEFSSLLPKINTLEGNLES
jgi:hypothetical protein